MIINDWFGHDETGGKGIWEGLGVGARKLKWMKVGDGLNINLLK